MSDGVNFKSRSSMAWFPHSHTHGSTPIACAPQCPPAPYSWEGCQELLAHNLASHGAGGWGGNAVTGTSVPALSGSCFKGS